MLPSSGSSKKQSIHINPTFKNDVLQKLRSAAAGPTILGLPSTTHINPLFMKAVDKPTAATIHMNPQFLSQKIFQQQQAELTYMKAIETTVTTNTNAKGALPSELSKVSKSRNATQPNKIISKSRTRIVRESLPLKSIASAPAPAPNKQLVLLTKRKLIRAPMLETKQPSAMVDNDIVRRKERFKVFNKDYHPFAGIIPILKRRQGTFVARYALRRSNNVKQSVIPMPSIVSQRKQKTPMDACLTSVNKQLRLININGILYKSTGKKLQRNVDNASFAIKPLQAKAKQIKTIQAANSKISKPLKSTATIGRTLYVRGAKYVMDPRGFKLTRVAQPSNVYCNSAKTMELHKPKLPLSPKTLHKSLPRRIDIGGVTYIASSQSKNIFVRTSTHLVLAHLNQAKQRSVHMLSRPLVKTNKPCLIFQRLGKCAALERNRCSKVHDKQSIIVCPKFLQGLCFNTECLLSHTKTLQKMPVCRFFLQGACVRNDCPYLHKKLRDDSEICEDFRRGFCALGEQCNKQHVFFKAKPKVNNKTEIPHDTPPLSSSTRPSENDVEVPTATDANVYRYFNGEGLVLGATENMTEEQSDFHSNISSGPSNDNEDMDVNAHNDDDNENIENGSNESNRISRRKQLGTLPAFIPLS